jgi:hypothetical protein
VIDNVFNLTSDGTSVFAVRPVAATGSIRARIQYNRGVISGSATTKDGISIVGSVTGVFEPNDIVIK